MAIAEAAAEAADAAAVPAAAGKASKCPEKQQTKKSQTQLGLDPVLDALEVRFPPEYPQAPPEIWLRRPRLTYRLERDINEPTIFP